MPAFPLPALLRFCVSIKLRDVGIVPNDWSAVDIAGEAGGGDTVFSMRDVDGLRL